ncbi:hypothetical protein [Cupriavidus pauculus]|uniref:Uncharacterized protein n=1 Tax=Cupriavidus pauculus TaxID=82633 RepID=A0A2N5C3M7_9BURK|nr:hypothetical protein [Cupriavidus pauculus]PLP96833.1 hypothetical protein CYJ10_30030 [Cupriavidus pauculus]
MPSKTTSKSQSDEWFAELQAKLLPEIECPGSWQLFSKRLPPHPDTLKFAINMSTGTCDALELTEGLAKNSDVGDFLNRCFCDVKPERLYFDGDKSVHMGALVIWAASNGVSIIAHPLCTDCGKIRGLIASLTEALNIDFGAPFETLQTTLASWRESYNAGVSGESKTP